MNDDKQLASDESKKDVNVLIEISKDGIEASVTLIPLTESPKFSTDEIRKELSDKGIKIGIKKDVFELLEKELTYNQRFLIASGTKPAESKDGEIKFNFKPDDFTKVKKGDEIGEIIPPVRGKDGLTVLGETIPSKEVQEAKIPELENVEHSPEREELLLSKIDGYLSINLSKIHVVPFFELEEIKDEYEAFVKVKKLLNESDFNEEDLKNFLNEKGIVLGILDEEIKKNTNGSR